MGSEMCIRDSYIPLRVSDRDEAIGLDDCEHKETAYPTFMGMDS
mgnify:FL=1